MTGRVRRRSAAWAIAAAILVVAGCAPATPGASPTATDATASPTPLAVTLDQQTRDTLQQVLENAFATSGMPGIAAYVRIGDEEWESSLGVGDLETQEPYDADAVVRIASNTKTFTATAVLQLVDDGALSLDDTIDQYVPGITNGDRITVRNLLSMTSGVWEFTTDNALIDPWVSDPAFAWTPEDSLALIAGKPAQFEPGEKVVYTDSNFVLLGLIVEAVSGQDVGEFITENILEPLELSQTRFPAADERGVPDPHQQGYRPPGEQLGDLTTLIPVDELNPDVAWTAGNMTSTIADLATWTDALVEGDLLSPELQAERLESTRFDGQKINFGYGLGIVRLNDFAGHDGAIVGYSSVAMRYPEADATFVITGNGSSNATTPTLDVFIAMVEALYPDQLQ